MSWVIAKTKTRLKKSSRVLTRSGWPPSCGPGPPAAGSVAAGVHPAGSIMGLA